MSSERRQLRGVILSEDKRTERFVRHLLKELGFKPRNFLFRTAPRGQGAAESWVAEIYPDEVKAMRSKNYQRSRRLLTVRDADKRSIAARKAELDSALEARGIDRRERREGIATPVPMRNIETWLLHLLGVGDLDEATDYKRHFESEVGASETRALKKAASAWCTVDTSTLPSLADGMQEMTRLDP